MRGLCLAAASVLLAALMAGWRPAVAQAEPAGFPFSIPYDGLVQGSAPALLARPPAPAGAEGFVTVEGDRFVLSESGREIRFWGTNLTAGGCLPPHEVSERMARRMASLGINCVRLVGFDGPAYPAGLWRDGGAWAGFPHESFDPEALDRFDFLVAQLKEQGVYVDLALHVFRNYGEDDGFPPVAEGEALPDFGKGVDQFYPRCIEEQKRFARMLLEHVNPYTGNAYAREPAVAVLEVSNEDGLTAAWKGQFGGFERLPPAYKRELTRQWNDWLRERYASTAELETGYARGEDVGERPDLLAGPGVRPHLQVVDPARAEASYAEADDGRTLTIVVEQGSETGWHLNHQWTPFAVEEGERYVLHMRLRANREFPAHLACTMSDRPWANLGIYRTIPVGTDWNAQELYFTATRDYAPREDGTGGARILLSNMASAGLRVEVSGVELERARLWGLLPGEELGRVAWVPHSRVAGRTPAVQRDVVAFLLDTERAYWEQMRRFLKEDLGARMPVTGTAVGNTSPQMAAETMDYLDGHAYWHHPHFPGRPWDPANWVMVNEPMVSDPEAATMGDLAADRVFGLPYTVSEYNHPAPQDFAAEGFPLAAVYAGFQGWNGVFTYGYAHGDWEEDHFRSFFDIKADPVKLALQPACAALLRGGGIGRAGSPAAGTVSAEAQLRHILGHETWGAFAGAYEGDVSADAWRESAVGIAMQGGARWTPEEPPPRLSWQEDGNGRGRVTYVGEGCLGMVGFVAGKALEGRMASPDGDAGPAISLKPGTTSLDGFAVVMVNRLGEGGPGGARRFLLTAVTSCWNEGMTWNEERTSVGTGWGRGPTLCQGVPLTLTVRDAGGTARVFALGPDGTRRREVPADEAEGSVAFELGPDCRTLWYELAIGG
jgi:hypothetical protein